jgi:predicted nucleotidyltransferase
MNAITEPPWLVKPEKVEAVVQRLISLARPKKIILFGSYARGELTPHSELDVLVVTQDDVESPRRESVRLRNAVGDTSMPMDLLVPESRFRALRDKVGLISGRQPSEARSSTTLRVEDGSRRRRRMVASRRKRPEVRHAGSGCAGDSAESSGLSHATDG